MPHDPIHIEFVNQTKPKSQFELMYLEELLFRESLNHHIDQIHRVEFFILLFVTEGQGYHTVDFTDYKLEKGTLITIRKDQVHKFFRSNNIKGYLLLFTNEFLVSYLEKLEADKSLQLFNELLTKPKLQLQDADFDTVLWNIKRIEKEYKDESDDFSFSIIRSELHTLLMQLYRIKSQRNEIVLEKKYLTEFIIFQQLVEESASQTTRVADYAKKMALSTKTLNTISRNIVGKSAKEFIDEINLKQIKRRLMNTTDSVKEIAFASGFEETTNFYKYFKRQMGITPEQFRQSF